MLSKTIKYWAIKLGCSVNEVRLGQYYYLIAEDDDGPFGDIYVALKGKSKKPVMFADLVAASHVSKNFPEIRLKIRSADVVAGPKEGRALSGDFAGKVYIFNNEEGMIEKENLILKEC